MMKGIPMIPTRILLTLSCLAAGLLPATAHHQGSRTAAAQYLAFWSGYLQPTQTQPSQASCLEGRFWEKGFVSIYAQGEPISESR